MSEEVKDDSIQIVECIKYETGITEFCQQMGVPLLKSPLIAHADNSQVEAGIVEEMNNMLKATVPAHKVGYNSPACFKEICVPFEKPSPTRIIIQPNLDYFKNAQNQQQQQYLHQKIDINRSQVINQLSQHSKIEIFKKGNTNVEEQNQQQNSKIIKDKILEEAQSGEWLKQLNQLKDDKESKFSFVHLREKPEEQQHQNYQEEKDKEDKCQQLNQQTDHSQQLQLQLQPNQNVDLSSLKSVNQNQSHRNKQEQEHGLARRRKQIKGSINTKLNQLNQKQQKKRGEIYKQSARYENQLVLQDFKKQWQNEEGDYKQGDKSGLVDVYNIFEGIWMDGIETEMLEEKGGGGGEEELEQSGDDDEKVVGIARVQQEIQSQNKELLIDDEKEIMDMLNYLDAGLANIQQIAWSREQKKRLNKLQSGNTNNLSEWAIKVVSQSCSEEFEQYRNSMAISFEFELDYFQKAAVVHLEKGNSVFVSAHTSAGKTVVAEYAFALAKRHNTRAAYTSPIKTISNQKYRDFGQKGFNVGILTGDVQVNVDASCLIMTTEILRSMLYKGADIVRDLEFVVFDEVHYVNDIDRGVVWEEVIIMLPEHVKIVLLSATVPNVMEFADWVGRTKRQQVYVVSTDERPVPLQHYLYYNGQNYLTYRNKFFRAQGVKEAQDAYKKDHLEPKNSKQEKQQRPTGRGGGQGGPNQKQGGFGGVPNFSLLNAQKQIHNMQGVSPNRSGAVAKEHLNKLINTLKQKELLPCIIFVFSKKKIDEIACHLSTTDLLTGKAEKSEVHLFCEKCLSRLKEDDRQLPQIRKVRGLLKQGIGIHHAGLLPIVKEVVEMLFCRGLVRLLISTETFAMGVNAPARTVVFFTVKKHDGRDLRQLLPGEYIQMAGRAGRRGKDTAGSVMIFCSDDVPGAEQVKKLIDGNPVKLQSQFRLTYGMILNLLRVEDLRVEEMLRRSFAEFHAQRRHPETIVMMKKAEVVLQKLKNRPWPNDAPVTKEEVEEYCKISEDIDFLSRQIHDEVMRNSNARNLLVQGRVVLVKVPKTGMTEAGVLLGSPQYLQQMNSSTDEESSEDDNLLTAKRRKNKSPSSQEGNVLGGVPLLSDDNVNGSLYVVIIHRRTPLDAKPPSAAVESQKQQSFQPEEHGLVLMSGKKGRRTPTVLKHVGPLPRYGTVAGLDYALLEICSSDIAAITQIKLKIAADAGLEDCEHSLGVALSGLMKARQEAITKHEELPLVDAYTHLRMKDVKSVQDVQERDTLLSRRAAMPAHWLQQLGNAFIQARGERQLQQRIQTLKQSLSDEGLSQMPEFEKKTIVLQKLRYLDEDMVVQLKGRVACEINSVSCQVLATEMIFRGVLQSLSPEEALAVISPLVFQEKSKTIPDFQTDGILEGVAQLFTIAEKVAEKQNQAGLLISNDDYIYENLHFGLVDVVHEWGKGTPFQKICQFTDVMEGSIVRTIVRLEQACREIMDAARVMGDTHLYLLMEQAAQCIRRDVIFAASLYIAQ